MIQGFSKKISRCIPGWESVRKILNIPSNLQIRIITGKSTPFQLFSRQFSQWENFALPAVFMLGPIFAVSLFIYKKYSKKYLKNTQYETQYETPITILPPSTIQNCLTIQGPSNRF